MAVTALEGADRDLILAYLCVFPLAMKQHLRGERNSAEMESVLNAFDIPPSLPPDPEADR